MDLAPYVDRLRRELAIAAGANEDARVLAERLAAPLESAARLTLLEALSDAADEITRDLAPGSVEIRLHGRDPGFLVTPPPVGKPLEDAGRAGFETRGRQPPVDLDEGGTSRISLRVPEHLKPRIEEAAARDGVSVNAWLVRAAAAALESGESDEDGGAQPGRRHLGWVR
jgi:hypothetical protein